MSKPVRFLMIASIFLYISQAQAAFSPLSISIVPPVQFPPRDFTITGARVSALYGHQRDIVGVDLGLIGNITDLTFVGVGVSGLFNETRGSTTVLGLQAAGGWNANFQKTHVFGVQAAIGANYNTAESSFAGLQVALCNLSGHSAIYGFQVGLYNRAQSVYGFQIGVVNDANNLHGIQIGLLNYNRTGTLAVSPVLNMGF